MFVYLDSIGFRPYIEFIRALSMDNDGDFRLPNPLCPPYIPPNPGYATAIETKSGVSTPLKQRRSLRPGENEGNENHAYFRESRGEKYYGETKLLKHMHCLPVIFSKKFSLATLARLHFIFIFQIQLEVETSVTSRCLGIRWLV